MNCRIFIYFIDGETDFHQRGEVTCPGSHSQGLHDPKACVLILSPQVCLAPDPGWAPKVWQDRPAPQRAQGSAHSCAHRLACSESRSWFQLQPQAARAEKHILNLHRLSSPSMEPGGLATSSPKAASFPGAGSEGEGLSLWQRRGPFPQAGVSSRASFYLVPGSG